MLHHGIWRHCCVDKSQVGLSSISSECAAWQLHALWSFTMNVTCCAGRGGGEYGLDWRAAGSLHNKQNVFDDFQACAEHVISQNYTCASKIISQVCAQIGQMKLPFYPSSKLLRRMDGNAGRFKWRASGGSLCQSTARSVWLCACASWCHGHAAVPSLHHW